MSVFSDKMANEPLFQPEAAQAPEHEEWPDLTKQSAENEPDPFPGGNLPSTLLAAATEVARFTFTDIASASVVGLSVAATAIAKRACIEERPGLRHYPALFFAIIADSGERKSPVFKAMTRPLESWSDDQADSYAREVAKVQAENAVVDSLLASMKRQAAKATDEEKRSALIRRMAAEAARRQPIPASPRLFTSDCTEEKLFQKMESHGGAFGVQSGEGRQILDGILGRYSGGGRTGDGLYLSGISGDSITRDRVGNGVTGSEDLAIPHPCLNVCVMVQPDKFMEVLRHKSLSESGLVARILPVKPVSLIGSRFEKLGEVGLNDAAMLEYYRVITGFLNTKNPLDPKTGRKRPHLARLGPEAQEARMNWGNVIERQMGGGGVLAQCRDIAAKSVTQAVKIALVLHLIEHPDCLRADQSEVSLETWIAAQSLAEHFLETAILFRGDAQTSELDARRLTDWIRRTIRQVVTVQDAQQKGPRPRLHADDIRSAFADMCGCGVLRKMPTRDEWEVNPSLFGPVSSQNSHNSQ